MATRCQIGFYKDTKNLNNFEVLIYRHWDGYPEGVIPEILPILKRFDKGRGLGDIEYASAWLVKKLKKDYLNVGISKDFHGDIEYLYAILKDRIEVYEIVKWGEENINKRFEKIDTIKI